MRLVRIAPGRLMHRKTGPAAMCKLSVEPEQLSRKRARVVLYCRLVDGRPGIAAREDVDPRPFSPSLPPRLLEQTKKRGLMSWGHVTRQPDNLHAA